MKMQMFLMLLGYIGPYKLFLGTFKFKRSVTEIVKSMVWNLVDSKFNYTNLVILWMVLYISIHMIDY